MSEMARTFIVEFTAERKMRVTVDEGDMIQGVDHDLEDSASRIAEEYVFGPEPFPPHVEIAEDWCLQPEGITEVSTQDA